MQSGEGNAGERWARSIQPKFQPVRPGKVVHLKRWTRFFETFPVGPYRSIEFCTEISGNFGWMDRARWKITIGLISKKATLHVQHTFFEHFFAVVLHDYNVKLRETSQLHVFFVHFFFTAAHFHLALVAASISHFVTAVTKCSCCSSN